MGTACLAATAGRHGAFVESGESKSCCWTHTVSGGGGNLFDVRRASRAAGPPWSAALASPRLRSASRVVGPSWLVAATSLSPGRTSRTAQSIRSAVAASRGGDVHVSLRDLCGDSGGLFESGENMLHGWIHGVIGG